jgi:anti-sigma B factor antagonist
MKLNLSHQAVFCYQARSKRLLEPGLLNGSSLNMTSARHVSVKQLPEKLSIKQGRSFFREVEPHLQSDRPRVVLDCSKVRHLDSAGIHVLLRVLEEAMKRNGDVKLASIPPAAAAILELTRVGRLFETFDSTADAVNSFDKFRPTPVPHYFGHMSSPLAPRVRSHSLAADQAESRENSPHAEETVNTSGGWLRRQIAGCLVLLLIAPLAAAATPQQETSSSRQTDVSAAQAQSQQSDGGAKKASYEPFEPQPLPNSPSTVRSQTADGSQSSSALQPSPNQLQDVPQEPVGTAAAEFIKTTGVAASKPAGSAIAPAKQRRARSILIKVGAIVGAGAAVGAVVALSAASPSRAPGSH